MSEKVNLQIKAYEDKVARTGKSYTRFNTNIGWVSVFEKEIIEKLKIGVGQTASVELAVDEDKGFKNIRQLYGWDKDGITNQKPQDEAAYGYSGTLNVTRTSETASSSRDVMMQVSYAKDIFCELLKSEHEMKIEDEHLMKIAIELVKQAREAFS